MGLTGLPPAAFMRSGDPDDPRSQRTRALLLSEYEQQLASDAQAPTVASLVRGAGVSRGAFYRHFTSIENVGVAAVRAALEQLGERGVEGVAAPEGSRASATQLTYGAFFAHILGHRPLFAPLFGGREGASASDELREVLILQTRRSVQAVASRPAGIDTRRVAAFIVGAVLTVVGEWLQESEPCPPDELAEQIMKLLPTWFVDDDQAAPTIQVDVLRQS